MKILVTRHPFGEESRSMLERLALENNMEISYTNLGRECDNNGEIVNFLKKDNPDIILAGTEKYNENAFDSAKNLKMISRVGIGLDSLDLKECEKRGITVGNGMGYMANSVAELTIYYIINCLRRGIESDSRMRRGEWDRYIGRDLSLSSVGIIGYGRIGKTMERKLNGLETGKIYINDMDPKKLVGCLKGTEILGIDDLLRKSDIVTLHIPLNLHNNNEYNKDFILKDKLEKMKNNAVLINTSRGGIVNENDLYKHLKENRNFYAALDVPPIEPYRGKLLELPNCYFTSHLGSCTQKSASSIESAAIINIKRYLDGERNLLV